MANINALLVDSRDDVCVASREIKAGETVRFWKEQEIVEVSAKENIPVYYKMAIRHIIKGTPVLKYGVRIGVATTDIDAGAMVHTQNLVSG